MTTRLITSEPEQTVRSAVRLLLKHRISGLPVVSEQGVLVGMLSEADCMRMLAAETFHQMGLSEELRVMDLMSTDLHCIGPELDLYSIAQRLSGRLRRLPVLEDGVLVGQISRCDVLRVIETM